MTTRNDAARGALLPLSIATAVLTAAAALAGLAWPELYRDAAWVKMTWFGNDLVTLVVALPLLAAGIVLSRRGSVRGTLLWATGLYYPVYNYSFYLHGALINVLFPLYVLLFVLPLAALIGLLARLDVGRAAASFSPRTPVRLVGTYLMLTGLGLTMAWLGQWAAFVFGGTEPSVGEGPFAVVATMDLTTVVPLCLVGGVLLWRRRAWGYVIGTVMSLKGATYTLVLTVNSVVGTVRGFEGSAGQIPVWGVWTLLGLAAAALLLGSVRESRSTA